MKIRSTLLAASAAAALGLGLMAPATATASTQSPGTTSLAEVLTSDGNQFDSNKYDYDIVTEAVLAVLAAKPASPVGLLADGTVPLTAFIPNDRSFRLLVRDLTGHTYVKESRVFSELAAAVGIDNIEAVLLYHVVPGAAIDSGAALASDGAALTTALGSTFTVDVIDASAPAVALRDNDPDDRDPRLVASRLDINAGNLQIAHGIRLVLRPLNL